MSGGKVRRCVYQRSSDWRSDQPNVGTWHALAPGYAGRDWVPILCGVTTDGVDEHGIGWGTIQPHAPTCPECSALIDQHGSVAAAVRAIRAPS